MAVFYKQDIDRSPENGDLSAMKLAQKAQKLAPTVSGEVREKLAALSAKVNSKITELKSATKEQAEILKREIRELSIDTSQGYIREDKSAQLKKNPKLEKLLAKKESFDSITTSDIGRIREYGENIANFLLTDTDGEDINLTNSTVESYKNKPLLINFWNNQSLKASTGLGDILPYEVKKVEVTKTDGSKTIGTLGSHDSRKWRRDRVGYYDENGIYIAVYHGYSIKILEIGTPTEIEKETYTKLQSENISRLRIKEMTDFLIAKNGYKKIWKDDGIKLLAEQYLDQKDKNLYEMVIEKLNSRVARGIYMQESYKDGIGSRDKFIGKFGWYFRDVIGKDFPDVPAYMLINLFDKESDPRGSFDPNAYNPSSAYGLGQMKPPAWADAEKHSNMNYDRSSPYDQIHASASYIDNIMKHNNCTIKDAIVYYHMWPSVKKIFIDKNDLVALETYKKANGAITKEMKEDSWAGYMAAARYYYTEEPTLLTALDLSKTGTELASKLGDYVMSTILPDTGASSCGKAVGILLNRFGIEALPQSGRDGKNWDDILNPRVQSWQFKKIAIRHPDEAGPWAVLVYDGSGQLWTDANKNYGHVEIKWSDSKYYSYYEWNRAWGSAATTEKWPEAYRVLTGFTGYAYYPISKQA